MFCFYDQSLIPLTFPRESAFFSDEGDSFYSKLLFLSVFPEPKEFQIPQVFAFGLSLQAVI